jgi:hypothetical protein
MIMSAYADADAVEDWSRIHARECPLIVEPRTPPVPDTVIAPWLERAPFAIRAEGDFATVMAQLAELPDALCTDVAVLVQRFMLLMQTDAVRVRMEGITTNACKKVHADYTDVRLITTYSGPGTDYAPNGEANDGLECYLDRVPTGAIALFKGRTYASDHPPCFHRSPPVGDTGEKRLVLVIDTLLKGTPKD